MVLPLNCIYVPPPPLIALAAVRSKEVVPLLLMDCLLLPMDRSIVCGVLCLVLVLLCVLLVLLSA